MTLNGHFALKSVLKSVLGSATNGLVSPAFGQNVRKFAYTVSDKNVAQGT